MKNITIILLLLFSFALLNGQTKQSINKKFASKELNEDLDVFIQSYYDIYPSLYRYRTKSSVDSSFSKIRANIKDSMTEIDFYKNISSFCSFIGDVHSGVIPSKNYLKYEKGSLKKLPFKVDIVNKKLYVLENYSNDLSIKPGSEILSINSKPSIEIINELIQHITTDGYNQTYKYHYLAKHFGKFYTRIIDSPDLYHLEIISHGIKVPNKISVFANIDKEIKQIRREKYAAEKIAQLDYKVIGENIGYLRISSFNESSKNISGMKLENFIDSVFTALKSENTANLIIDVRWNGGGDDKNGALLYSYLTDKPFKYYDCLCVAITANDKIKTQNYFEDTESIDEFKEYLTIDSIGRKIITLDDHPNTAIQLSQINNYKGSYKWQEFFYNK